MRADLELVADMLVTHLRYVGIRFDSAQDACYYKERCFVPAWKREDALYGCQMFTECGHDRIYSDMVSQRLNIRRIGTSEIMTSVIDSALIIRA